MSETQPQYQPAGNTTTTHNTFNVQITGKSMIAAYLIWWFLGFIGIHRLYLGNKKSGFTMMALFIVGMITSVFVVGFFLLGAVGIWWLIDAYLTSVMVKKANAAMGIEKAGLNVGTSTTTN